MDQNQNNKIAVRCTGVTKVYGKGETAVQALRGIDLVIERGKLTMLVGPSGCGKTTLISIVAGILYHDQGTCIVFGKDVKAMTEENRSHFRSYNVGFVFQAFNLLPTLTTTENVAIPLLIHGLPRKEAFPKAHQMLDKMGLKDRFDSLPAQLSGGQQQRVAIARALVHEPKLIVCDEPTSSLDHETGQHIMEILKQSALAQDTALLVVTHDARIFPFADSIAKMDDGRIIKVVDKADEL